MPEYTRHIRIVLETPDAKSATVLAELLARRLTKLDADVVEAVLDLSVPRHAP